MQLTDEQKQAILKIIVDMEGAAGAEDNFGHGEWDPLYDYVGLLVYNAYAQGLEDGRGSDPADQAS